METNTNNTKSPPDLLHRRWVQVAAGLAVLLVLLLVLTPHLMAWAAQDWLLEKGADAVEIEDIDFNPFTGTVVLQQLKVKAGDRDTLIIPSFMMDIDWSPLFSRRADVRTVTIDGVHLTVEAREDGGLRIGGISLPEGDTAEEDAAEPWGFGIAELDIRNSVVDYRTPEMQLETGIEALSLRDLTTWVTRPAPLTFRGTLNGADVSLDGQLPALAEGYGFAGSVEVSGLPLAAFEQVAGQAVTGLSGRLTLDTRVDASYREDRPLQVEQDGLLRLEDLQLAQADNRVAYTRLEWQGTTTLAMADAVDVSTSGALSGNGLDLALGDQNLGLQQLQWQGTAGVSGADALAIRTDGKLAGSGLDFVMPSEGLRLQQDSLAWDGSVGYTGGENGDLQVSGSVRLEHAQADPVEGDAHLVGFDTLTIDSVSIQGLDAITIDNLVITGAALAEAMSATDDAGKDAAAVAPLEIASLSFDHIEVSDRKRVSIDTIESREARYSALRTKDGQWRMATIMESLPFMDSGAPAEAAEPAPEADGEPGSLRVGVLKNTDSIISIEDQSVKPPFRMQLSGMEAVRDVDTARPDQDTHIYMKLRTARHDSIEVKGTVRPLASPISLNLETNIEGLEMPPLSPYAIASIGHRLDSGQLDAESSLRIDKGQLDGMNNLVMKGLRLSPVKGDELEKMQSQLAVPLDKGLDMLRDDHDVIKLKLPITGDLDNPGFDASDAINQAVAKATKEGAIASLTLLLQPYGSLITVARYAADKATAVRLDPVVFAPASAEIAAERHEYLDKVAGIIRQRPQINIKLCGIATPADRAALAQQAVAAQQSGKDGKADKSGSPAVEIPDEKLIRLADDRDAAVKDYLVGKFGIKAGRLVACQPGIDQGDAAKPRVDLLI